MSQTTVEIPLLANLIVPMKSTEKERYAEIEGQREYTYGA